VGDDKHLKKLELPDAKISGDISAGTVLNRIVLGNTGRYPLLWWRGRFVTGDGIVKIYSYS
jgi:hypothetical protein